MLEDGSNGIQNVQHIFTFWLVSLHILISFPLLFCQNYKFGLVLMNMNLPLYNFKIIGQ